MDALTELHLRYDSTPPRDEYLNARYGHRAHERIVIGGDLEAHRMAARRWAHCMKRYGRSHAMFGQWLAHCRLEIGQWRKLRAKYRRLMREIAAFEADRARGLYRQAAE